jgi:adenosylcobyric acid synthase
MELAGKQHSAVSGRVNVAVILLRHISNFTDFGMLERDPRVNLYYTNNVEEIGKADIIILPGTKSTIDDLYEIRRNGVAEAVLRAHKNGTTVLGICGGYQMMGMSVDDPQGVEGSVRKIPGLGLLPVDTVMEGSKVTRQVTFHFRGLEGCTGYEIHMGRTEGKCSALNTFSDGTAEGCFADERTMGTYIHGILDNPQVIDSLLAPFTGKRDTAATGYFEFKQQQYDLLADHVRRHLDMPLLYKIMSEDD